MSDDMTFEDQAEGGFLVRITDKDGKVEERLCHACSFDYDMWQYCLSDGKKHSLPSFDFKIEILPHVEKPFDSK